MAGFLRRFGYFPGVEQITQIEGVVVVDLPPPGSIQGVATGVACLVGEFVDMTYACAVGAAGAVVGQIRPVEALSAQDLYDKVGGFDATLGEFGKALGNGFCELRNKKFSRLVVAPINLCSDYAQRLYRKLPTNNGSANPVVNVTPITLPAGVEFKVSATPAKKLRTAQRVTFTDDLPRLTAASVAVLGIGSSPTNIITVTPGGVVAAGVAKGDAAVIGQIGGAGAEGLNAGTYRVVSITDDTHIVVERQDGTSFAWTTGTVQLRIHPAATADTGGANALADAAGLKVRVRNIGGTAIAPAGGLVPAIAAPVETATTWDPLSGLALYTLLGVSYSAEQAPNAANSSALAALYATAIDALLSDEYPARDVNLLWAARKYGTIRAKLREHVLDASSRGVGRMAFMHNDLSEETLTEAVTNLTSALRDERVCWSWPGVQTFVPEAVGTPLAGGDGVLYSDGFLDGSAEGWLVSVCSNLPPERNPGQAAPPVPEILAPVTGFQRMVTPLGVIGMPEYKLLRSKGFAALRNDKNVGFIFQSGITTSLEAGRKNINRRRMADFIEDSISNRLVSFCKLPLTDALKDAARGEVYAFLNQLLSPNNPPAQRIAAFEVDVKSGNTPDLEAQGIFVIIARVRTLATADFIVLQAEIGEGVKITTT